MDNDNLVPRQSGKPPTTLFMWVRVVLSPLIVPAIWNLVWGFAKVHAIKGTAIKPTRYIVAMVLSVVIAFATLIAAANIPSARTPVIASKIAPAAVAANNVSVAPVAPASPTDGLPAWDVPSAAAVTTAPAAALPDSVTVVPPVASITPVAKPSTGVPPSSRNGITAGE